MSNSINYNNYRTGTEIEDIEAAIQASSTEKENHITNKIKEKNKDISKSKINKKRKYSETNNKCKENSLKKQIKTSKVAFDSEAFLDNFMCPITNDILENAVTINPCGHTVSKMALEQWLKNKDTCPAGCGGIVIGSCPNFLVRTSIEQIFSTAGKEFFKKKQDSSVSNSSNSNSSNSTQVQEPSSSSSSSAFTQKQKGQVSFPGEPAIFKCRPQKENNKMSFDSTSISTTLFRNFYLEVNKYSIYLELTCQSSHRDKIHEFFKENHITRTATNGCSNDRISFNFKGIEEVKKVFEIINNNNTIPQDEKKIAQDLIDNFKSW